VNNNDKNLIVGWNDGNLSNDSDDDKDVFDKDAAMGSMSDASMGWAFDGMEIEVCTDGLFHPSDLKQLFQHHRNVIVGCVNNWPIILDDMEKEVNLIIVYPSQQARTVSQPTWNWLLNFVAITMMLGNCILWETAMCCILRTNSFWGGMAVVFPLGGNKLIRMQKAMTMIKSIGRAFALQLPAEDGMLWSMCGNDRFL